MGADGRRSVDGRAPVAAWQRSGDPRVAIRLRDLLHMASGLDHVEEGDPVWASDTVTMLFGGGAQDMAGFAEAKPAVARSEVRQVGNEWVSTSRSRWVPYH